MHETELEAERIAHQKNSDDSWKVEITGIWFMLLTLATLFASSTTIVGATEACYFPCIPY